MSIISRRHLLLSAFAFATSFHANASSRLRLEDLCEKFAQENTICAAFKIQKKIPGLNVTLESLGRVVLWKNHGLMWQTTSPFNETLVFGRRKTLIIDDTGAQSIREFTQLDETISRFDAMLGTDSRELSDRFFISLSGTADNWQIIASPKSNTIAQYLTEVSVHGTHHINRALIVLANSTISEIQFHNQQSLSEPPQDCAQLFECVL